MVPIRTGAMKKCKSNSMHKMNSADLESAMMKYTQPMSPRLELVKLLQTFPKEINVFQRSWQLVKKLSKSATLRLVVGKKPMQTSMRHLTFVQLWPSPIEKSAKRRLKKSTSSIKNSVESKSAMKSRKLQWLLSLKHAMPSILQPVEKRAWQKQKRS
jgi:hypothetical protein